MLHTVVSDLVKHGIFLVPVGELEWWLRKHGIEESRETKWAWANAAAARIQGLGAQSGDVWDFIRSVGAFLRADAVQPDDR
jgi:hypothetical protein